MENTGRILRGVTQTARRILFDEAAGSDLETELRHITRVDKAHLVMLAETGLVERERACRVLGVVGELEAEGFAPLRGRAATRGVYLLYENYLIERLGGDTGGVLQTGRSRNDLNATTLLLRLRGPYQRLLREALRLQAVLLRRAARYGETVMPAYTHYQAAVPVTYGHYLAGVGCAVERDIGGLLALEADLNRCPLGAGSVGGTSLPIDPERTASLLGFDVAVRHSADAVASRDLILRLLAASAVLGVTLSRAAGDLLLWTTAEFGLITLPDSLVSSSSMMPQKRNPFLLEHVQGRSAKPLGAFVSAATAMHAKPFTNSISVGTEAVAPVWDALKGVTEAALLLRLVVAGAAPQPEAMMRSASDGYTTATELANRLVVHGGMAFRTAHHGVGEMIRAAVEHGNVPLAEAVARWPFEGPSHVPLEGLDPEAVAHASAYGGGPGRASLDACLRELTENWSGFRRRVRGQARKWEAAQERLEETVGQLCGGEAGRGEVAPDPRSL